MTPTMAERIRAAAWCTITLPWALITWLAWRTWACLVNKRRRRQAWLQGLSLGWQPEHSEGPDYHWMRTDG